MSIYFQGLYNNDANQINNVKVLKMQLLRHFDKIMAIKFVFVNIFPIKIFIKVACECPEMGIVLPGKLLVYFSFFMQKTINYCDNAIHCFSPYFLEKTVKS
jgi:hypothetical protein